MKWYELMDEETQLTIGIRNNEEDVVDWLEKLNISYDVSANVMIIVGSKPE